MPELSWEKSFSESVVRDVPNQFTDYAVFNVVKKGGGVGGVKPMLKKIQIT